jgi:hypothetical protein
MAEEKKTIQDVSVGGKYVAPGTADFEQEKEEEDASVVNEFADALSQKLKGGRKKMGEVR